MECVRSDMTLGSFRRNWLSRTLIVLGLTLSVAAIGEPTAGAAASAVGLGSATTFGVLAASTVTNTGASTVNGSLAVSPGTAITGFPPGLVSGTTHSADAVAGQAQTAAHTAYNDAAGRPIDAAISSDLGGQTLVAGVYGGATLALNGTLTLDGKGDPNSVFILQAGSTLTTATNSSVALIGGAQSCNVFWKVGSSATLGTGTTFRGTILALASITLTTGTSILGRAFALTGAVTMDTNTVSVPSCTVAPPPTTTTTLGPTTTTTLGPTTTSVAPTTTTATPTTLGPTTTAATPTTTTPGPTTTTLGTTTTALSPTSTGAPNITTPTTTVVLVPEVISTATTRTTTALGAAPPTPGPEVLTTTLTLPKTGTSVTLPLLLGVALFLVGLVLLFLDRRNHPGAGARNRSA